MPISTPRIVQKRETVGPILLPSLLDELIAAPAATDPPKKNGTKNPKATVGGKAKASGPKDPVGTFGRVDVGAIPEPEGSVSDSTRKILGILAGAGALTGLLAGPGSTFGAGALGVSEGLGSAISGLDARDAAEQQAYQEWMADALDRNAQIRAQEGRSAYDATEKERIRLQKIIDAKNDPLAQAKLRKEQAMAKTAEYVAGDPEQRRSTARPSNERAAIDNVKSLDREIPVLESAITKAREQMDGLDPDDDIVKWMGLNSRITSMQEQLDDRRAEQREWVGKTSQADYAAYESERAGPTSEQLVSTIARQQMQKWDIGGEFGMDLETAAPLVAGEIERMVQSGRIDWVQAGEILQALGY